MSRSTDHVSPADQAESPQSGTPVIAADSLVEEVSIDGMCGVY